MVIQNTGESMGLDGWLLLKWHYCCLKSNLCCWKCSCNVWNIGADSYIANENSVRPFGGYSEMMSKNKDKTMWRWHFVVWTHILSQEDPASRKCLGFVVFVISYMIMLLIAFLLAVSLGPQKKAAPVGLPRLRCPATTLALCPSLRHLSKESRLEV